MHICKGKEIKLDFTLEELETAAEILRGFSDSTRIKMMAAMYNKEQAVCDIAKTTALSHSLASHQLSAMKKFNLVKSDKQGKNVFYSIDDNCIYNILALAVNHIRHINRRELSNEENLSD